MSHDAVPLVSIVIPAFVATPQQATLLDETLATVDAQTCRDYEVLVVDDGSPRDVAAVARRHPRTRTLRRANAGSAMARNTGIAASRGRHFVFLDADDHLLPPALETGLARLDAHPTCGFVVGRREEMTYEGDPVPWGVPASPRERWLYDMLLGFDWHILPPSTAMFRRDVVTSVGGFRDPWGADDLDFYLRVAWRHEARCYDDATVTRYRRYAASTSRDGERMLRGIRVVYERQRPLVRGHATSEAAYARGLARLTDIFVDCLVENVRDRARSGQWRRAARAAAILARERPRRLAAEALGPLGGVARRALGTGAAGRGSTFPRSRS